MRMRMKRLAALVLFAVALLMISPAAVADVPGFLTIVPIGEDEAAKGAVVKGAAAYGHADAIIVATLELDTGRVRMLSVDRDYHIVLPEQGDSKLCLANYFGGPMLLIEQINALLGLSAERYAMVDKTDMGKIVTKMGGVTVDVREEDIGAVPGLKQAGPQKLSGAQAVAYMGARDVEDVLSDVGRNERQRLVLGAIMEEVFSRGYEGMIKFATAVLPLAKTNITFGEIIDVAGMLLSRGVSAPQQARSPELPDRLTKSIRAHNVVYVEDMAAEAARVWQYLYGGTLGDR